MVIGYGKRVNTLSPNDTWHLVSYHDDFNLLSCKWLYHMEYNSDGSIDCKKACLVVRGFDHLVGLDYNETFIHVVKRITIRIVLTLAITYDWVIHKLEVKNALLHHDLHEKVYMTPSQGFVHPDFSNMFANNSLYGLKQAP